MRPRADERPASACASSVLRTMVAMAIAAASLALHAQGDVQVRERADALFGEKNYLDALPLYSQLVSLHPADRTLNYRFGTCLLFGGTDRDKAIGHLKFATQDPSIPADAWYWLGRAYHLNYQFKEALAAYQRYQGVGGRKELEGFPIAALDKQCRNGLNLLSNLKEITVHGKTEVAETEFFRFYELGDIGGKIVVLPDELKTSLDRKSKQRALVYLPAKGGPIYFASLGKDGKTGRDIYRTELLSNGTFAPPVKLAGYVNTDQDEDFAFMHPDGRNFYFSSSGHNSMGGFDIFRSAYDRVSETFGPPENMDFAVNTPDDDIFYMTDGESKQACFASGRDSEQGKLHVYRVATAQIPLVITVMKGTYASALDKADRKAHIVVEDAITHERVADVHTDINGSYVLSVPRSGRFRYLVECGPGGRMYKGDVEVPRSTAARAYRQELELVPKGDLQELVIRNYFDSPLDEDMIALMMEEIRRRARLDVTPAGAPVIALQEEAPPAPAADIMTQLGFTGDMTEARAVQLAREDANEQEALVQALDQDSKAAYAVAITAAGEAERLARDADRMAGEATATSPADEREVRMKEAATVRQRSQEANLRARAAHRAAMDIDAERMIVQQRAATAARLATDLGASVGAGRQEATITHLRTLKQRLDTKLGPDGELTLAERSRRALADQEKEAARRMNMATAKRAEESEFADRIERERRERDATRSKARKEELARSITEQEQQLAYLHAEAEGAFNTAREQEIGTSVMRGRYALIQHLSTRRGGSAPTAPSAEEVAQLGQRIAGTDARIAAIPIDAGLASWSAEPSSAMESRAFNWDASYNGAAASARDEVAAAGEPAGDAPRTNALPPTAASRATTEPAAPRVSPVAPTVTAVMEAGISNAPTTQGDPVTVQVSPTAMAAEGGGTTSPTAVTTGTEAVRRDTTGTVAQVPAATGGVVRASEPPAELPDESLAVSSGDRQQGNVPPVGVSTEPAGGGAPDAAQVIPTAPMPSTGDARPPVTEREDMPADMDAFLLRNEKAELEQVIAAEKNGARRDSLRKELGSLEARIIEASTEQERPDQEGADELSPEGVDMTRMPLIFYPDAREEAIVAQVYPGYGTDRRRIEALRDPGERAEGLSGLELMLADSLRGEMVRQAAVLELSPAQGGVVLPRIERLRALRQAHLQESERLSREVEELPAGVSPAGEDIGAPAAAKASSYPEGRDPIADRFVAIKGEPGAVYESHVEHRSTKVREALASKEADLARMQDLDRRIDSLEAGLVALPRKEYDVQRRAADKLMDERMIVRIDMGQRTAFLTREEWRTATDSLRPLDDRVASLGLPPDEHLLVMSGQLSTSAKTGFTAASAMRRKADRTEDIVLRDSLYSRAYQVELKALAEVDQAITVKNYLLGPEFQRGVPLSYEEVARRVLGISETASMRAERSPAAEQAHGTGQAKDLAPSITDVAAVNTREQVPPPEYGAPNVELPGNLDVVRRDEVAAGVPQPDAVAEDRVRREALAFAERQERSMPGPGRAPVGHYERMLAVDTAFMNTSVMVPELDPLVIATRSQTAARASTELEQRSLFEADQATAFEDSAATARPRERERLERLAARSRLQADSLHSASMLMAEEARSLELQRREAERSNQFRERLVKYYYLSADERSMVVENPDLSRYFQARARALEQRDAATEAEAAARVDRELGEVLRREAEAVKAEEKAGRLSVQDAIARRDVLYGRAEMLSSRADSLSNVAVRLREAASMNEAQASVMLQARSADRASEWMALEMRTRRTEPQPGQATALPGGEVAVSTSGARQPAPARVTQPPAGPVANAAPVRNIAPPFSTDSRTAAGERPRSAAGTAWMEGFTLPSVLEDDLFELRDIGQRREVIPMDVALPQGVVFKVQIGAFRTEIGGDVFSDMAPVMGEHTDNGLIRYTAGLFTGFQQAAAAKDKVRARGYRDAFVVAYRDGVRIPLAVAMREARATAMALAADQGAGASDTVASTSAPEAMPAAVAAGNTVLEPAPRITTAPPAVLVQSPVVTATVPPTETAALTTEQVLARYPASADAIVGSFMPAAAATAYYNAPGAAPAVQVETIKGLFYTVQVGVYSKPVPLDKLYNITPLNSERTETAKVRYTTGRYPDIEQARGRKEQAVASGVKDAFVTAYLNGRRIPMQDAAALLERFGPAILAVP